MKKILILATVIMHAGLAHSEEPKAYNNSETIAPYQYENDSTVYMQQIPAQADEPTKTEEENPAEQDQSTDHYIKDGYDSEVFPHKDPGHFVF